MEANKDIPAVTKYRSKLLDMAKCEDVLKRESSSVADENLQLHQVLEDRGCIADGDSWCLEDIHTTDPKIKVLALKALVVRKDKEYEEMQKCKEVLQKKVDQFSLLLKRYERSDEARASCNMEDHQSLMRRMQEMIQEKNGIMKRLDRERNLLREQREESGQLKQKFNEEIRKSDQQDGRITQFEHNEVVEQLLISNHDLSRECLQLKKKLNDTVNALAGVEEQMESVTAAKLGETENCNSLACELALSQAKALHLEQLAHVEVGRMMSESSSSLRSGSVNQNSSQLRESIAKESSSSLRTVSVNQNSSLLRESCSLRSVNQNSSQLREYIVKESSSSLRSGSVNQNSSLLRESCSLRSVNQNSSLLRESIAKESTSSLRTGSVKQNSSLLRESIVKESSSSLHTGSVKQNSSLLRESCSLRSVSVKQNSSLLRESIVKETKSKIPVLRPTIAKVYSSNNEDPVCEVAEKELPERTEIKSSSDFHQPTKSEGHDNPLSPTVLPNQKVNFDLNENKCTDIKSPINFSDMDDNELCQYQLKLMEARDNGTDMDPVELDAQIKELNLHLSGQSGWSWENPEPVTPRPCFVKFSVHGWRTTAAKIRHHFNRRGVTGVEVFGAAAVVRFNTPEDAKAVLDDNPHVVGNCHLVPGPVVMVEEGNGLMCSEIGAMCSKATFSVLMGSEIGAMCSKATCSVLDDGDDDVIDRTVELFKTGEANEELLKAISGVESATTDGNTVKLTYAEQNVCEEVLEEGYIMVGEEKMLVGRIGQLGWVEIEVTGSKRVVESEEVLNLLERAGIAPVLDMIDRGGGMFGIVLENAKRKQLMKRRKLPLEGGMWATVVEGHKHFHGDLEKGEELAGKMIEPVEEEFKYTRNTRRRFDHAGSGFECRPTITKTDVNDNLIDEAIFTNDLIDGKRAECLHSDLQKVFNEIQTGNKHFGYKNVENNCPESFEEDTCADEDKEMEEPLEAMNESLGYSSSASSNVDSRHEDCLPNPTEKKQFQVEVVKIYLTSSKSKNKKVVYKTNETECQNTRARSTTSFNDATHDHGSG